MAKILAGNKVQKSDGTIVDAQQGAWYDAQQYWGGTLSNPGQINPLSNQQGAGQDVSPEINRQTSVAAGLQPNANQDYINSLRKSQPQSQQPTSGMGIQTGSSAMPGSGNATLSAPVMPTIDLNSLYQSAYESSGIRGLEEQLSKMNEEYITAKSKSNDNPFLSEASRVGREAKLAKLFDERTANIRNDIATKKADVETKLNLQMKQFDINSEAAKTAFNQLNTLIGMGALDNASGESIANLTRSTGIPSDVIYSAVNANKAKNVKTELIKSVDDNGNVTVSVIDTNTGNLISQNSLGAIENKTKQSGGGTSATTKDLEKEFIQTANTTQGQQTQAGWVGIFPLLVAQYAPYMSLEKIYQLWNQSAPGKQFGKPGENAQEIKQIYDSYRGK